MSAEPYKIEILEDILTKDPAAPITVYHVGALDTASARAQALHRPTTVHAHSSGGERTGAYGR